MIRNKEKQASNTRIGFAMLALKFCSDQLHELIDTRRMDNTDQQLEIYWSRVKTMLVHLETIYEEINKEK